jgi:hypothetical protein
MISGFFENTQQTAVFGVGIGIGIAIDIATEIDKPKSRFRFRLRQPNAYATVPFHASLSAR